MLVRITATAAAMGACALTAQAQDGLLGLGGSGLWAGAYAGATVGAVRSTGEAERGDFSGPLITLDVQNGLFPESIDDDDIAAIGGLHVGYNVERGAFVGGVELDYALTSLDVEAAFSRVDPNPNPPFSGIDTNTTYGTAFDGLATLRLRAGRDVGGTLVYATAGVAVAEVENRFTLDLPDLAYASPGWDEQGTRVGYAVGLGVERRLNNRVSFKAEVIHVDLEDATVEGRDPVVFEGEALDYRFDNAATVVRVGVNVRF